MQKVAIVIGVVIVLAIGGFFTYTLVSPRSGTGAGTGAQDSVALPADTTQKQGDTTIVTSVPRLDLPTKAAAEPANPDATNARQIAKVFVERFGTFSSQSNNAHITDAMLLATQKMNAWMSSQALADEQATFSGKKTQVIASSVQSINAEEAVVLVEVQETSETQATSKTVQRKGEVHLLKQQDTWLVDALYWQ